MRKNGRLDLRDLQRRLKAQALESRHEPRPSREADDGGLFRETLHGVTALPPPNQADLHKPLPPPLPRSRNEEDEQVFPSSAVNRESWIPSAWFDDSLPVIPTLTTEQTALAQALRGVTPLSVDKVFPELPKPLPQPRQSVLDEQAALAESIYAPTSLELRLEGGDELHYLSRGVPRGVLRDLRRGRWVIQQEIDLHGATRDEARDLLAAFMGQCRRQGTRCVRVVHGKGRGSPGREPVLKGLVAGWLMNYEDVMAYCQARLPDGGAGALVVLLKAQRPATGFGR